MNSDKPDFQRPADLNTLLAAANSQPDASPEARVVSKSTDQASPPNAEDPMRIARIAELRSKFNVRTLTVDEAAVASKLIDAHLKQKHPSLDREEL